MTVGTSTQIQPVLLAAGPEDEPTLRAIHAETHRDQFAAAQLDEVALSALLRMQYDARRAQYTAAYPGSVDRLVLVDGQVVGHCWTDLGDAGLRLLDIAVRPAFRRRGVAAAVMRIVMREAVTAGVPVALSVWVDNDPARRLYARLGFVPAATEQESGYLTLTWFSDAGVFNQSQPRGAEQ
jgi:ribosomal protein S18 acetylase RimI-like enzyme